MLTWDIGCDWEYDPCLTTEVEVRFIPESPSRTRIELEHRGLEAYAENADAMRERYDGDNAWSYILQLYATVANPGAGGDVER